MNKICTDLEQSMTQEDKELLFKDLSARLSYGVICQVDDGAAGLNDGKLVEINISKELVRFDADYCWDAYIDDIKPYLRPMSSMTKVEMLEYISLKEDIIARDDITYSFETYESIDWLNKKMFDYRGLIPMGLALVAHEGMYN